MSEETNSPVPGPRTTGEIIGYRNVDMGGFVRQVPVYENEGVKPDTPLGLLDKRTIIGARTPLEQRQDKWPVENVRSKEPFDVIQIFDDTLKPKVDPPPSPTGHKGVKLARFDLLPFDALWQVAIIFGIGARKYAARNWERGYDWSKSFGAVQRHLALWWQGENVDPETGRSHLAHAVVNLLFLMAFEIRRKGTDDRSIWGVETMKAELTNPEEIEAARKEVEAQ